MLEDGSILRTGRVSGDFGGGGIGGMIEIISWEGELLWQFRYADSQVHQHHDVEILPNGNILVLAWERVTKEDAEALGRTETISESGLWPDHVVELRPEGLNDATIVWEWHVKDHLIQDVDSTKINYGVIADHPERININAFSSVSSDWNHCNAVDYNPQLDQIILSSRNFNEFWIIDHSTTTEEAASTSGGNSGKGGDLLYRWGNPISYNRGNLEDKKLYGQHDVHWIEKGLPDEGKIMIFNNGDTRGYSTVDIIVPPLNEDGNYNISLGNAYGPSSLDYTYEGNDLFSPRISGAQQLSNGNVLICEGFSGRFFEVDKEDNVVWTYQNPISINPQTQGDIPNTNSSFRAYRYPRSFPAFVDKDLTPGLPIELGQDEYDCQIFGLSSSEDLSELPISNIAFPNPVGERLYLKNQNATSYSLVDLHSRIISGAVNQHEISTDEISPGIYILTIYDKNNIIIGRDKIVKL